MTKRILFSDNVRSELVTRQNEKCLYCNKPLFYGYAIIEHKIPLSRGGTNEKDNLAATCFECDFLKGAQTADEFMNPKTRKRWARTGQKKEPKSCIVLRA